MQFRKDKAKPRQTPHTHLVCLVLGDECSIQNGKTAEADWRTLPFQCWPYVRLSLSAHKRAIRDYVSGRGRNRSSHASCVLVLLSPDLSYPVIPSFSHEKCPSAHRPCPFYISTLFQHGLPVSYTSHWPAVLSFRSGLFCDAHSSFPVRKKHATPFNHLFLFISFGL